MYKVTVQDKNYDTIADYTGCISFRISDSGVISTEFCTGENKLYRMQEGDEVCKTPMTDEEIFATPKLGEWYKQALADQEELAKKADS